MSNILESKKMQAARAYLDNTGRNVIDEIGDCLIYEDAGTVAIGKIRISVNSIVGDVYDCRMSRDEFEDVIYQVMLRNPEVIDCYLRPDTIELFITDKNRGILRHHVDAGVREV